MNGRWAQRLVIFVKAPRAGRAKTRLAADIGAARAACFYRQATRTLIDRLGDDRRWETVLAVDPTPAAAGGWSSVWPEHLPRVPQGAGDLGVRMERLVQFLPPGPVVIIGSDAPQVTQEHIAGAFRLLREKDAVFGPAPDGGYWLIGLRRVYLPRQVFSNIRWSTEHALADTRASLPFWYKTADLSELTDVDEGADFAAAPQVLLRSRVQG